MIDWTRVRELQDEIGPENMEEVLELFMLEVDSGLAELPEKSTATELTEAMHFLKGCAMNIGFRDLATLCKEWETAASKGDISSIDPAHLTKVFAQSRQQFESEIAAQLAA